MPCWKQGGIDIFPQLKFEDAQRGIARLRRIEDAKISCARKLFNEMSTSKVKYHDVKTYQNLLDVMKSL